MDGKVYKVLIVVVCCWLTSCVKDKPGQIHNTTPGSSGNIYVVCEGNFGIGDASLYAYDPSKDSVYGDLYAAANHQPLGDVFQSMIRIGDKFFLCVNNSDKVVAINAADWTIVGTMSIKKPRYILPVSADRAYVSTLYSNKVYIINTQTIQVTGTIELPNNNPEGMCLYNGAAMICTWDTAGKNIFAVDVTTNQITQTLHAAGYAPQEILVDRNQTLWVLAGNQSEGRPCTWTHIDPSTGSILKSFTFPADADAIRPVINKSGDTLYFIEANYTGGSAHNGIYRMSIYDTALPAAPFVAPQSFQYFWGLGIDPATGYIYAGDPKGFIQKGTAYIYRTDGTRVDSFNAGLGPGHFYFDD